MTFNWVKLEAPLENEQLLGSHQDSRVLDENSRGGKYSRKHNSIYLFQNFIFQILTALGLTHIFDSYIDIYDIQYFNIVFSFLSTYFIASLILIGTQFRKKSEKATEKVLLITGAVWSILSTIVVVLALYIGEKTVHLSKKNTLWLLVMVASTGLTFLADLLFIFFCTG